MTITKAQYEAQKRYDAAHTKRVYLKLNVELDTDVLAWLSRQSSMQGAIKKLIRKEIKLEGRQN